VRRKADTSVWISGLMKPRGASKTAGKYKGRVRPAANRQHLSFFATALLFWWTLQENCRGVAGHGAAVGYLFATALHTSFLGILLVFSPVLWYAPSFGAAGWGLTPLEDQQLAGLIMWVPGGLIYAGAALLAARAWIMTAAERGSVGSLQ
jgi:cytochrome c oxidase assembly factor CtaG